MLLLSLIYVVKIKQKFTWFARHDKFDMFLHTNMLTNGIKSSLTFAVVPACNDCVKKLAKTQQSKAGHMVWTGVHITTCHLWFGKLFQRPVSDCIYNYMYLKIVRFHNANFKVIKSFNINFIKFIKSLLPFQIIFAPGKEA